jgi:hypothetical protein
MSTSFVVISCPVNAGRSSFFHIINDAMSRKSTQEGLYEQAVRYELKKKTVTDSLIVCCCRSLTTGHDFPPVQRELQTHINELLSKVHQLKFHRFRSSR